jgi:ATP-dependent Clp protease adaptor protein ClpS
MQAPPRPSKVSAVGPAADRCENGGVGGSVEFSAARAVPGGVMTAPAPEKTGSTDAVANPDVPWVTIVWNDPVNLMSYVTLVFQKLLGHPRPKAEALMLDVHHKGRATVSSGPREKMEADVAKLQAAGLWATMARDS